MKDMKQSTRRWKTLVKKMKRKKVLHRAWGFDWRPGHLNPLFLETPSACSCTACSNKNAWDAKSRKRNFRDSERKDIEAYYKECYEMIEELDREIADVMGWD